VVKLLFILLLSLMFLIFASQNLEPVFVHLVLGPPVKMPTIVLVFSSFMAGVICTLFFMINNLTKKNKNREEDEEEEN